MNNVKILTTGEALQQTCNAMKALGKVDSTQFVFTHNTADSLINAINALNGYFVGKEGRDKCYARDLQIMVFNQLNGFPFQENTDIAHLIRVIEWIESEAHEFSVTLDVANICEAMGGEYTDDITHLLGIYTTQQ